MHGIRLAEYQCKCPDFGYFSFGSTCKACINNRCLTCSSEKSCEICKYDGYEKKVFCKNGKCVDSCEGKNCGKVNLRKLSKLCLCP